MFLAIFSLLISVGLLAFCGVFASDPNFVSNADLRWSLWGVAALGVIILIYGLWKLNDETDVFYNLFSRMDKKLSEKLDERDARISREAAAERACLISEECERGVSEEIAKKAAAGDADAQTRLAVAYYVGEQLAQDYARTVYWARRAYKKNDTAAALLADCYNCGYGVKKSIRKAIKYARPAADRGNHYAQCTLGFIYTDEKGRYYRPELGVFYYQKAAEAGNSVAQNNLAVCYEQGTGVARDYKKARAWLEKAAAQDLPLSQCNLAFYYLKGIGGKKDVARAKELLTAAAEGGDAKAKEELKKL